MKQVLQNIRTGETYVETVPAPAIQPGHVLVRVAQSLISAGTEKMVIEFAEKSLVRKSLSRPDLAKQVFEKIKRDGLLSTWSAVGARLAQPLPLGYSNAGTVVATGEGVEDLRVGDAVSCGGGGFATHAEVVCVPKNLAVKFPRRGREISFEEGCFATVGAIGLHGFRLARVEFGGTLVVLGLGLIGLISAQIAKSAGCLVIGIDPDDYRSRMAKTLGCDVVAHGPEEARDLTAQWTQGIGADAVLITAATESNEPVLLAGDLCRDRGSVIAIGAVGTTVPRKTYYHKELNFIVSRSYGPGRYDNIYELKGQDYPIGYVRWTERRNMEAILQAMASGHLEVKPLITHRFPIENAGRAYDLLTNKSDEPFIGVVLTYSDSPNLSQSIELERRKLQPTPEDHVGVGVVGAGNFASNTLIPVARRVNGVELLGICAATGANATTLARSAGFRFCTTAIEELLRDREINLIVIATRHHLHFSQVVSSIKAGKNIFCEKPLCLSESELAEIIRVHENSDPKRVLFVGYNRRFAPYATRLKAFVRGGKQPICVTCRINAGFIPAEHWTQDTAVGGGRLLGEVCHFIDLAIFMTDSLPSSISTIGMANMGKYTDDNIALNITFTDGSIATILYFSNGDKTLPKERIEVFSDGRVGILDDFKQLTLIGNGRRSVTTTRGARDKGHRAEWQAIVDGIACGVCPIPDIEIYAGALAAIRAVESLKKGSVLGIDVLGFVKESLAEASMAHT